MAQLVARGVSAWYRGTQALRDVSLTMDSEQATAIIGPSGCGKSTLLRCLNRMHELRPGARTLGDVLLDDQSIYAPEVDPTAVRRRVGLVFERPNPFPTMSIRDNVLAGARLTGLRPTRPPDEIVETALEQVGLWDEVRDRLHDLGVALSTGQQQRLCIARALAIRPEVILMDEPCSALDTVATSRIEDLIASLRETYTVVIVTHDLRQAARVSQRTAFMVDGQVVEVSDTGDLFTSPSDPRTEDFLTGKFG